MGLLAKLVGKGEVEKVQGGFNAVIEGTFHDDWRNFHYKLARLDVPTGTTVINDGVYKYRFHLTSSDGRIIDRTRPPGSVEATTDFLGFCPGVVLPYRGGTFSNHLERPRTVIMGDGRMFIEREMGKDVDYVKVAEEVAIRQAMEILFRDGIVK
jgi:hypothetical protein